MIKLNKIIDDVDDEKAKNSIVKALSPIQSHENEYSMSCLNNNDLTEEPLPKYN